MRIDLFDLRLFVHVAEHSSLTRGAELSAISVPAASTRLKNLETAAGAPLLTRTSHGVELTDAGRLMLEHARRISLQVDSLTVDLQEFVGQAQLRIRLMATTTAMAGPLPAQIGMFINEHPSVIIDLNERRSTEIIGALREGRVDIGVLNETAVINTDFEQHAFCRERLVLAVPKGHRFARCPSIMFNQTLDEQHINLPAGTSVGSALPEIAAAAGAVRGGTRVSSFESLCRLVEMGIGVGAVTESSAARYRGLIDVDFVPLDDPWAHIVVKLVARSDVALPRMARRLFEQLRSGSQA